jgi:hypothetical protein
MKNLFLGLILLFTFSVFSQKESNVRVDGILYVPKTQTQRLAMVNPKIGMTCFQTDGTSGLYVYTSNGWLFATNSTNITSLLNSKADLSFVNQKLHTVNSIASLQAFSDATIAQFDGSIWERKSGNVTSNGGAFAGTLIRVSSSVYWERQGDYVTPEMFGAKQDGVTDDTQAINNACASTISKSLKLLEGFYKITGEIVLNGRNVQGVKDKTFIRAYGCNGFRCVAGTTNKIEGVYLINYTTAGAIDARLNEGILFDGTASNSSFNNTIKDVYCRGFKNGFLLNYTWNSTFDNVHTFFVENAFKLFGQSVNNFVSNSNLEGIENGVLTLKDGVTRGEGLAITNTTFVKFKYGIKSDGFLLLQVSNSVIDQIINTCIDVTAVQNLKISNSWLYSNDEPIIFQDLGSLVVLGSTITDNIITSVNKGGIVVGGLNSLVGIDNNTIITNATTGVNFSVKTQIASKYISITNNTLNSAYAGNNIFMGGELSQVVGNIGDARVQNFDASKRNIILNNNGNAIVTSGAGIPTAGTWTYRDIIWNEFPVTGGYVGWVCTAAGNPGTWKGFGLIE